MKNIDKILKKDLPLEAIPELLREFTFLDVKYDAAFKRLFSDVKLLQHFLNTVLHLQGRAKIRKLELRSSDIGLIQASEDVIRVDVRAQNGNREWFDVEMQKFTHSSLKDRAVLYGAIVAAEAHREALLEYHGKMAKIGKRARYRMPKVICLWLLGQPIDADYGYREEWAIYRKSKVVKNASPLPESEVLNYIWIDLSKFDKEKRLSKLERDWLELLSNSQSHKEVPAGASSIIRLAYERIRIRRTPKEILERQENSMVTQLEIDDRLDTAVRNAVMQTRKEVRKEVKNAVSQNTKEVTKNMAKQMLKEHVPLDVIARVSKLPMATILSLKA